MNKMMILALFSVLSMPLQAEPFDWSNLKKQRIDLKLPLLIIEGKKGILACGYIDTSTCEKTGEACAIVSGVNDHSDMLLKPVVGLSSQARKLGIKLGMTGEQVVALLR